MGHFTKDRPSQKQESHEITHPKMDLIQYTFCSKAHVDHMVKKSFVVWEMIQVSQKEIPKAMRMYQ